MKEISLLRFVREQKIESFQVIGESERIISKKKDDVRQFDKSRILK